MKYFDVFGEAGYHSALMTTYAFSAQAFEDIPLPRLRGAGCRNIAVMADSAMLNMNLAEYGVPRYAGTLYHLTKVSVGGAFHPKMTLLVGPDKGRLLIGSANLTALGLAGNKELVTDVRYSAEDKENASLFAEAVNYLRRYIPADDPWFHEALVRAFRYAPWLDELAKSDTIPGPSDLSLLADTPDQTILSQIEAAVADDQIERLIVLSPYWDTDLEGLTQLRAVLGGTETDILIDPDARQFPASAARDATGISLFNLKDERAARFVHAKLFVACGRDWDHVISGSMNCSAPALLGPTRPGGNAEIGLYKRVARGRALPALKLDGYRLAPLELDQIPSRLAASDLTDAPDSRDGGSFTLQGERLFWTPPGRPVSHPLELRLFDREGLEIGDTIKIDSGSKNAWNIPNIDLRPKTARVRFEHGWSAPTVVIDLDALAIRTLPPHREKKSRIADRLSETTYEDLFLLQAINELEALDLEDQPMVEARLGRVPNGVSGGEEAPERRVLTYEAFVQARARARAEDSRQAGLFRRRYDGAADLVSVCLNRLIGLVASDLSSEDEEDLRRQSEIDLRNTEPLSQADDEPYSGEKAKSAEIRVARQRVRETAKKIGEAVAAFEQRTKRLAGKRINTTELVRLRTLLQIVLAHAQPKGGAEGDLHVLPITGKGGDWPRLLGRLLNQHFKVIRSLQALAVEADENERDRVLEYLAVARYAAQIAVAGARSTGSATPLLKPLEQLAKDIEFQVMAVISCEQDDVEAIAEINDKLNVRFAERLGLQSVPRIIPPLCDPSIADS